ncbi:NAD-dependent epimerase/dehydratase family protein [Facklamia miroungae]|uniref:UDP-glucose 4-epimerase n=1 Tax=Facklamia miroungae TaxID=120956 RepID=A0A1G7PI78_9LACT|nr:NAD-dependent epimerase/dehydratase family protein [Facklamia miroungae]NKZ28724.1 NAD-dependent epimerase/dehydratase family protein [Facklamia miroungae]SDF86092.1 UDP-glucose 4-epimerase [Facklamia miroungae]
MTKKVLITGKDSYIGTSFIKYCKENNYDLIIDEVDTRNDKWKEADFSQYDVVFHVAGIAHANAKKSQSDLYYKVNTDLTIEIANHAKKNGVKQFIFMSSIIIYSSSKLNNGEITKDTIPYSKDPYGDSKIKAENGIMPLSDENFKVVILRPPMIYGKGSKGNYPKLSKAAQVLPVFPNFNNKRSMLHIDNLSEFIKLLIEFEKKGLFFPQNENYIKTSDMVKMIGEVHGKKIVLTKMFNTFILISLKIVLVKKIFGNLFYVKSLSNYDWANYQVRNFRETIVLTELELR